MIIFFPLNTSLEIELAAPKKKKKKKTSKKSIAYNN